MSKETILVIDDEVEIRNLIDIYLKNEGYRVLHASDGEQALQIIIKENVDLLILDIMMPKLDGIETCIKIRDINPVPIIMLSAKSQDLDKIIGLSSGADDYMTKPFNPLELIARVKSQLRRYKRLNTFYFSNAQQEIIQIDDLLINVATHEIKIGEREVKLTPREFSILTFLARNRGLVFNIEQIYEAVWQEPYLQADNTVMVHIRKIREKIEDNPRKPRYIKTVWGVGYKVEG